MDDTVFNIKKYDKKKADEVFEIISALEEGVYIRAWFN